MAIFLVLGKCENEIFRRIEDRTKEMLSVSQKRSIRFVMLSQDAEAHREVEKIRECLQPGDPDPTVVHVVSVFDGEEQDAEALRKEMKTLREGLELDGTVERYFHLIWLIHETPYPAFDYEKIGALLGVEHGTNIENQFDYVYLMSDKRSDLRKEPSDSGYVNGSTLLISRLLLKGKVGGGIYTVGIGQKTVSEHEIRKYAETKLAAALENSTLGHQNRIKEFCNEAFGLDEEPVSDGLYHYLTREMINGEFCMIEGEASGKSDMVTSFPKDKLEAFFENWRNALLIRLQKTPFIWDGERFFEENGGFREYLDDIESRISSLIQTEAQMVKVPFLPGPKRVVAEEYNKFVTNRKDAQQTLFEKFMLQWRMQANLLIDPIREMAEMWKEHLALHKENDTVIRNCIDQAQEKTKEIDKVIASMTFEDIISESKNMQLEESWLWLIGRLADAVMNNKTVRAIDLMGSVRKLQPDELESSILQPIHMSTAVKMACVSHGEQDVFGLPDSTFFIPRQLLNSGIESQLNAYTFTEVMADYQNIEAIALYPIAMEKYSMLTFIAQKPQKDAPRSLRTTAAPEKLAGKANPVSVKIESMNHVQDNPYEIAVSLPDYRLTLDWTHTNAASILCKVISPGEQTRTVTIQRQLYDIKGGWDISEQIRKGIHTIELWSKEKCESRIRIPGKAETIRLTMKDNKSLQFDEVSVCHQTLTVESVDGDTENMLDDRLSENLYFSNRGNQLRMPRPQVKGRQKKQYWEVYRMTDDMPVITAGEEFEGMYQIIVDPS